jgi:hypothetical protein
LLNANADFQSLYFYRSGNDLEVKDLRNNDVEEFKSWFSGARYDAAQLVVMTSSHDAEAISTQGIDLLVQNMAALAGTSGQNLSADTRLGLKQLAANTFLGIHV